MSTFKTDEEITGRLTDKNLIRKLLTYFRGKGKAFLIAGILMLSSILIDLALPIIFGDAIKVLGEPVIIFSKVIMLVVIYAICLLFSYIIQYFQTMILQTTGQDIIYQMREDVFGHIEKFSTAQVNEVPIGKLVTRVTSDTNTLNELFTNLLINLFRNLLMIVGVIVVMLLINIKLTLYVLAVTPFVALFSIIFRKVSRQTHRDVRYGVANVNAFLSENLSGMKVTQVFNQEEKKLNEFRDHNKHLRKTQLKQTFVFGIFRPSMYVLYLVAVVLVFWFGGKDSIGLTGQERLVAIATLIMFQQYIRQLFNPIQALADEFDLLQSAFASSEKIFEILDTEPGIQNEEDAVELTNFRGEIEFKNVWFRYIEAEWVLKNVSFKINAGDTVAFVGATGSGKSTILSLIVRNYDIQKGQILIDGIDIKNIKLDSLRRNFGQMLQDVFLFSGTISSNIRMRDDNITDEDIKAASTYVNANKFIEELPNKYEEEVRERGNNFSSGQRQLLSFARTIVHKPNVIILDEATANIDTETEVLIQDSMEKMMNIGTMIVVAHRLSTIQHADKIIVMQKGEILEEGTHQDLLKNKGHYFKLYELQYQSVRDIK